MRAWESTMKSQDSQKRDKLPVTAEVGGEGGSYADATLQRETFSGPEGNPRVESPATSAADGNLTAIASEGEQVLDDDAPVKHATEPPER
jgi:hypothetical protein